jgi:hypothetical protein
LCGPASRSDNPAEAASPAPPAVCLFGHGTTTRGSSVAYQCGTLSSGVNPMIFIPFSFDAGAQGPTRQERTSYTKGTGS